MSQFTPRPEQLTCFKPKPDSTTWHSMQHGVGCYNIIITYNNILWITVELNGCSSTYSSRKIFALPIPVGVPQLELSTGDRGAGALGALRRFRQSSRLWGSDDLRLGWEVWIVSSLEVLYGCHGLFGLVFSCKWCR